MAGTTTKRPSSPSKAGNPKGHKRARVQPKDEDVVEIVDDEDDLETVLALIKESEENEKRAKSQGNTSAEVIDIDDEDDAAMARRLAAEWGTEPLVGESEENEKRQKSHGNASGEVIDIEDDAAMARRLAAEWGTAEPDLEPVETSGQVVDVDAWEPSVEPASANGPTVARANDIPPDEELAQFRSFFNATRSCTNCGKPVKSPRGFVMFSAATTAGALPPSLTRLLHASCDSCGTNHCRGCFTPLECPKSCTGSAKNAKCTVASCCAGVRALAIFECLGGFDRQFLGERATSDSRALALSQQMPKSSNSVGVGGTGYGTDSRGGGYGRGGGRGRGRGRGGKGTKNAQTTAELASHWDEIVVRALNTLTSILPSPYADSAQVYDMLPHPSIGHLLSLSQLPVLLASLLRNDSVTDWITRSEVYYAMIALLRRMADCELTVEVLIAHRFSVERSSGLEEWMWEDGEITWEKDKHGHIEQGPPLYDHFKKLTKQCEAFLAGAQHIMEEDEDGGEETIKAVSLCGDIIAARDDMERAMSVLGRESADNLSTGKGKGKGKNRDPAVDMEKAYSQACEMLSFKHVEIDYAQYNYFRELDHTESGTRTPKNRLHLIKELAMMATSLPPGIWVRVDEVRNDAIKVMIAGPEGTPYSGGLFEFDCFMPLTYPETPPLMHLRTTGGGAVRFNPNLYSNGKVCLSLLGTWPGRPEEQWSSSSTLLQVLVSIQSMILIDVPYYNEPGRGKANPNAQVSINYNRELSRHTCRWAMIEWLHDTHKNGIWKDVIASHFTIRKDKIRERILEWAAKDRNIRSYSMSGRSEIVEGLNHGAGAKNLDLVAEFDAGIARVQRW
ncbi:hypothetical protein C8R45DRAFT_954760 [Mycena sanguinolenta]|nr:hypothetical protein C8R45DRAFT_954760 [Mycena sanguinolenta]